MRDSIATDSFQTPARSLPIHFAMQTRLSPDFSTWCAKVGDQPLVAATAALRPPSDPHSDACDPSALHIFLNSKPIRRSSQANRSLRDRLLARRTSKSSTSAVACVSLFGTLPERICGAGHTSSADKAVVWKNRGRYQGGVDCPCSGQETRTLNIGGSSVPSR